MPKHSRLRKKIRDQRRAVTQAAISQPENETKLASMGMAEASIYRLLIGYRANGMFPPTADDMAKCLKLKPQLVQQSLGNLLNLKLIEAAPRGGRSLMAGYRIKDFGGRTL